MFCRAFICFTRSLSTFRLVRMKRRIPQGKPMAQASPTAFMGFLPLFLGMYSSSGDRGSGSSLPSGELWLCSARVLLWEALLAVAPARMPRRTRAFLAPRPFSAVAATTAAMFRSHPPFTALPAGNCSLRKGPPPLLPSCLQTRNYISQKPAEPTQENYFSQETPEARTLACFPPVGGGVRWGGVWVLSTTPRPRLPMPLFDWWGVQPTFVVIGRTAVALPAGESPTPTSSREEGLEFRVVAQS